MKKILLLIICTFLIQPTFALDKYSQEYLTTHKHFAIMNPFVEKIIESIIKSSLNKEVKGEYKVQFEGYTLGSIKKGIFKKLNIQAKNIEIEKINIPLVKLKTITDYNYVDYNKNPIVFKSDMDLEYELFLSEESINQALNNKDYQKVLNKINNIAYPMFETKGVKTKIQNNKLYVLIEYNFPINPSTRNKIFVASSDFEVKSGKIKAINIKLDSAYGKISLNKVANLLNLLNPLEFTLDLLESKKCDTKIEQIKFVDNNIQINGKIFIKGDSK